MNYLEAALEIAQQVYFANLPLTGVSRNFFARHSFNYEEQKKISGLISCELHHHLAIVDFLKRHQVSAPDDLAPVLWFITANSACYHHFDLMEMLNFGEKIFSDYDTEFPSERLLEILTLIHAPHDILNPELDQDCHEYLSLRFNTPLWLIKMWEKHLGPRVLKKLLPANERRVQQLVRLNPLYQGVEALLTTDDNFIPGPVPNTFIYQVKQSVKRHPLFIKKAIFQQRGAVSLILSELDYTLLGNCLIYEEYPQAVYLDVALNSFGKLKIDVAVSNDKRRIDIDKTMANFGLKNVFAFVSKPESLITQIRDEYHLVFVLPASSSFDLIRTVPDFFVHFNQNELDQYLLGQMKALEELVHYLAPGGKMIYMVNTISLKEGHGMIIEFLKEHRDLTLIKEKQFLPFDRYNSSLYVAILERQIETEPQHEN